MFSCKNTLKITVFLTTSILALPLSVYASLAEKYPGDVGIESDPNVVFVENFEEGSIPAILSRWDSYKRSNDMSLVSDVPPPSSGAASLLMRHVGGQGTAIDLYRRLLPGYDKLYFRFYAKIDPACNPIHHFVGMGGYNPPTPWPQGTAGYRPDGDDHFTTAIEPHGTAWRWDYYTYWMEMRSWQTPEGVPDGRPNPYYGNGFITDSTFNVVRGEWLCIEVMVKMNNPTTERNGEQAVWVNGLPWYSGGQLTSHLGEGFPYGNWQRDTWSPTLAGVPFDGFRWRSVEELKLNFFWLETYITTAPTGYVSKVWFDDIVIAKEYIGPIYNAEYECKEALRYIAEDWLDNGYYSQGNLYEDNIINLKDFSVFASQWPDECEFYTPLPAPAPLDDFESYSTTTDLKTVWHPTGATETYYNLTMDYMHTGLKSLRLWSDNSYFPYYCGVSRTDPPSDWTINGTATGLSLWFRGTPSIDELYVRLTDSSDAVAVVKYSDAWDIGDLEIEQWQQWTIDLSYFTDYNPAFDSTQVKTLEVGVGDCVSPRPVGAGPVFFDDIGLYR
ncbi:MAG: hypothetical protein ACYS9Y_08380 [Planctomycetota bacterium]